MQICRICKISQELTEFYFRKDNNTYRTECKICLQIKHKERYEKNKSKIKKRINNYKNNNRDMVLLRLKRYRCKNAYKMSEQKKMCYKRNKEKYKSKNKQWKKNNSERYSHINRMSLNKRRALEQNLNENFTLKESQIVFNVFSNQYFNCDSNKYLSVDHFKPLSKGNVLSLNNAIILCRSCNSSKSNKDPEKFFTFHKMKRAKSLIRTSQQIFERLP